MIIINQFRDIMNDRFTESQLFIPWVEGRFCWVLEDPVRAEKIDGETAIPAGIYRVTKSASKRFKKEMLLIYTEKDFSVDIDGLKFTGIRPHGGNDVDDTEGCPLLAFNSDHLGTVWGRASDRLFEYVSPKLEQGLSVYWVISERKF